ncbi:MAG: sensor histidine kinase [Desulfitobacteriaceae bacterium]
MTLRRKFLLALVGMVVFLSIIFGVISLWSMQALQGHAIKYIGQSFVQQWDRLLTYYYEEHGSWDGTQNYVDKIIGEPGRKYWWTRDNEHFYVFDSQAKVVAGFKAKDIGKSLAQLPAPTGDIPAQWHSLQVKGKTVGYFWLDESLTTHEGRQLPNQVATSLIRAMLIGLVITSLVAVLLGVLLTRHFTVPLRRLIDAVKRVGQGDLSPRLEVKGNDDIALLTRAFNGMTEQLTRNEEVRRNMVADIAHELRTPLAVILGKLESIQEGVLPSVPEVLLPIQDETLRLIRLVRDLQQLTLAEAGKLSLSLQPVDLRSLLERILEKFAYEFQERGIRMGIEGSVPQITADPDRLTQVFVNLVGNALLHTSGDGMININFKEGSSGEGWVKVEVKDTGDGIPGEELDYIFDRFYRVDKSRERETGHTGLGLAIAKEFIQAHGGRIEVQSTPGIGTCFTVWLPREIPAAPRT